MSKLEIKLLQKLEELFKPYRYKVLYGGRGGAKSWGIARALLTLGTHKTLRIVCARELQTSIRDSVHKLLSDQVQSMGMGAFYDVQQTTLRGLNGTEFFFVGLRSNISQIKSYEGIDICWVEEANTVSKTSWETLIPTIRKEKSEIWVSFNPELQEDETYQRFIMYPPENSLIINLSWRDNPWFPDVLRQEKDALQLRDPQAYENVWEGKCKVTVDGAVFGTEMQLAESEGRITKVPYNATKPVHRIWDIGWGDKCAVWFVQMIGFEYHLIRYHEDNHKSINHFLSLFQTYGYVYDTDWMPHDADNEQLAANGKTVRDIMINAGTKVRIIPRMPKKTIGINAARNIFNLCWFDRDNCADGLQCLRHYQYELNTDTRVFSKEPLHNWASHGADAFQYIGLMVQEPRKIKKQLPQAEQLGWMG